MTQEVNNVSMRNDSMYLLTQNQMGVLGFNKSLKQ